MIQFQIIFKQVHNKFILLIDICELMDGLRILDLEDFIPQYKRIPTAASTHYFFIANCND
jgi:hypothetical protein